MATTYCVMLENIFAKTCLTKEALMAICPGVDACYAQRVLKEFEKTGIVRELRSRKTFEKPSVKKRAQMMKAIYVQHMQLNDE